MFKRANKITSLLIAIAAVISIIPTGVSAANTEEIESKKGEIYNAMAYKDGKFYISGEPYKKDEAAYYLSNGKYTELKDIDSEDKAEVYGTKYVEIEDGDYFLDLSNGKVDDDNIKEDELDKVSVNLRSEVKSDNDGRYDSSDAKNVKEVTELPKAKFAEGFYEAQYKAESVDAEVNGGADKFNVYTSKDGKYIDADYNIGKVKIKLSSGKTATIENTSDEDEDVRASITDSKVIGQDSSNIYRLAKITVKCSTSGVTIKEVNGVEVGSDATSLVVFDNGAGVSFDVIQVISKSQASKEVEGIKYAKTVSSYILSDKDGEKIELLSTDESSFTIVNGKIINYKIDGNEIEAEAITLKTKSSTYYIEVGDNDHVDLQDGENSVDLDAQGNLWALSDDNIYKFDNDEDFEKIYSLDEEYSDLSVYDKDNIVIWNADEEIYSIISKKTQTTDDEDTNTDTKTNTGNSTGNTTTPVTPTPSPAPVTTTGWQKDSNGKWSYNNADGTKFKGWLKADGAWYYLDTDGTMTTGWKYVDNKWYFLESSGAMKTGWLNNNGTWYYLNSSGEMLSNTTVGGYKLGKNGVWIK